MTSLFIRAYKFGRGLTIVMSAYSFGHMSGLALYAADPRKTEKEMAMKVLQASGASGMCSRSSKEVSYVSHVGGRIIEGAKAFVRAKIAELDFIESALKQPFTAQVRRSEQVYSRMTIPQQGRVPADVDKMELNFEAERQFWHQTLNKLKGDWHFIVASEPNTTINAFITDVCPRRVFVLGGILRTAKLNPDELAVCLAHELSHIILEHGREKGYLGVGLNALSLGILIAFPELSLAADQMILQLAKLISNQYSRDCETEADELGVAIASTACYDVKRGANLFAKLGELETGENEVLWFRTHPKSSDRLHHAKEIFVQPSVCSHWEKDFEAATLAKQLSIA